MQALPSLRQEICPYVDQTSPSGQSSSRLCLQRCSSQITSVLSRHSSQLLLYYQAFPKFVYHPLLCGIQLWKSCHLRFTRSLKVLSCCMLPLCRSGQHCKNHLPTHLSQFRVLYPSHLPMLLLIPKSLSLSYTNGKKKSHLFSV